MPLPSIPGLQIIVSFLIEFIISSTQVYSFNIFFFESVYDILVDVHFVIFSHKTIP